MPTKKNQVAASLASAKRDDSAVNVATEPDANAGVLTSMVAGRKTAIGTLAITSVLSGFVEAVFLVAVTRGAFAITEGRDSFGVVAGVELTVSQLIMLGVLLVAIRFLLGMSCAWQSARLSSAVIAEIRRHLATGFFDAEWSAQHGGRSGRLQELLTTFAGQGGALIASLAQGIVAGCSLVALLLMAILVDPLSSLIVIGAVLLLGVMLRPLRSAVKTQSLQTSSAGMELATGLSELSDLGLEMHVFRVQEEAKSRMLGMVDGYRDLDRRLGFVKGVVPNAYAALAYLALLGALGLVATNESASLTSVGAVMLVMLRSLSYGQALQSSLTGINSSVPFLDALEVELDRYRESVLVDHGQPIGHIDTVELDRVSFEYVPGVPVLSGVTFAIGPSEVLGVVGPSGSGKSTLVQLLLGLRSPTEGQVLANGRDISVLSRDEWARRVTFVPQDAHLIAGTVADNIRFMRNGVTDENIERAARLAQLHTEVDGWAEGYERQVGERGSHLSGGQQQRLIIARALVERPDVLILDEPTSSVDVRSEQLIRDALDGMRKSMTIVIIAHRLSTLEICDRIVRVESGTIVALDDPDAVTEADDLDLSGG